MNTPHEFITAIETWYELKYTVDIEIKAIVEFLRDIPDLQKFFFAVTSKHSKKWKSLPDLAVMIDANTGGKKYGVQAEIWWQLLLTKSNSNDILITDPTAHFVVSGYGSWDNFCEQRDGDYRELTHKDFVSRYVSAMESGIEVTPRVLPGYYGVNYGIRDDRIKIVGDETRGRELLAGAAPTMIENLTSFIQKVPEADDECSK